VRNKIEGREDTGKEEEEDKEPEHGGKKKKRASGRDAATIVATAHKTCPGIVAGPSDHQATTRTRICPR
jgi:hypothetical protein